MKKLFSLLIAVMAVLSVSAQTKLTLGGQSANGNWSWGTTKTMGADVAINFSSQWGEFKLAAEPGDATGCKLVVAEPNAKVNIVVKFADGSDNQYIAVDATEKEITFPSAASLVELQGTEAGAELEVKSFVLIGADGKETQTTYSEVWGVSTYGGIYTSTSQWAQVMLNGAEKDEAQIVTLHCNAPVPAGLQLKVIYSDDSEGYLGLTAGETDPAITIEKAVKEVSLQFTAADLTIDIAYATTEPASKEKKVLYSYPFETATSHEYPATSTGSSYGTQNNLLDLNGVGNAKTTLYAYNDGTYKIAAWCGVEGYDLDFSLADDGTITVLNENAEYKESKGYWKVPTGLETYDRIQIFAKKQNSDGSLRSEINVSETQASVTLRYNSYVWETGNTGNASVMAAYYGRGFAGTPAVYTVQEAAWDDAANDYVETNDLNTQKTATANVYTLGNGKYVAKDWMGENTGDLYFTVAEDGSVSVDDIADLCAYDGFYYYYNINLPNDGIEPTYGATYNDGTSYSFGFWYGTDASSSDSYVYRYYFLEPMTAAALAGDWYENSKFIYYGEGECVQEDNPVTITSNEDGTLTISNLFKSEGYDALSDLKATVDIDSKTLSIAPQTATFYGYEWTLASTDNENDPVIGTISDDFKTINIDNLNIWYWGYTYLTESTITLTREKQAAEPEPEPEPMPLDAICGTWNDNGNFSYYGYAVTIENQPVTITRTGDNTVKISGLLCNPSWGSSVVMNNVEAVVDMDALTVTVAPQTVSWYGYDWDLSSVDGADASVIGKISADKQTITFDGFQLWYWGWDYLDGTSHEVLSRTDNTAEYYVDADDTTVAGLTIGFAGNKTAFVNPYADLSTIKVNDAEGNEVAQVAQISKDNYRLEDYACDTTVMILSTTLPEGAYTLVIPEGTVVMGEGLDVEFNENPMNIAFNVTSDPSKMVKKGNTDSIDAVAEESENAPVYTISGIRMNNATLPKGVYIRNGKKVMVK